MINYFMKKYAMSQTGANNLRKAVLYGLPKDKALLALTENPAKLVNQFDKVGSISKGKLANFIIVSGDIFEDKTKPSCRGLFCWV